MGTLEQRLLDAGLLAPGALREAEARARRAGQPLAATLLAEGLVEEARLLPVLASYYGLELVSLEDADIAPAAVAAVSAKLAAHYGIMPVRREGGVLTIAVADPLDTSAAEDIETNLGCPVERMLAGRQDIRRALQKYYGVGADTVERILSAAPVREGAEGAAGGEESHDLERMAVDASVVRLVNQLLQEAIQDRATDVHFEMHRGGVATRRRIDGVLYDTPVPRNMRLLYPAIVSRIKLMGGMNIVERRLPQDGRARVRIGAADYDLRISVVPAMHGEDVVIRILPSVMLFNLQELGFGDAHLALLEQLVSRPHGILFVTGPTGSGKSTTLYACLRRLNTRDRKVITIEDPIEYELPGTSQTQVNPRVGLTFARALRSMLRHDPDVMMVGEVRDRETAEIAVQTAMTGHLVLSTLHTNDAAGGAVRLIDMGIDPYLITSTVLAFVAQRLVRVICPECREAHEADGRRFYRGRGCRACANTGYRGRLAIAEILPLADELQELVLRRASAREIRRQADALGMATLLQDGEEKVRRGVTTAEELLRVINLR